MSVDLISTNFQTWAMLGIIVYLVKILVKVDRTMIEIEVRVKDHNRRITKNETRIEDIRDK